MPEWKDFDLDNMPFVKMNMMAYTYGKRNKDGSIEETKDGQSLFHTKLEKNKYKVEIVEEDEFIIITIYHDLFNKKE